MLPHIKACHVVLCVGGEMTLRLLVVRLQRIPIPPFISQLLKGCRVVGSAIFAHDHRTDCAPSISARQGRWNKKKFIPELPPRPFPLRQSEQS